MVELSPKMAATIAQKVYLVRTEEDWSKLAVKDTGDRDRDLGILNNFSLNADNRFMGTSGGNILRSKSGFGFIAQGVGNRQQELLITTRGTITGLDWVTDLMQSIRTGPSGYPVHAGFQNTFASFQPVLRDYFASLSNKPTVVHVVGHSLGGALATIICDFVTELGMAAKLYTFGSPRTGTEEFSRNLTRKMGAENIFRVHHSSDPVSMVPIFPFYHTAFDKTGYRLTWDGCPVSVPAHFMAAYITSIGESNWVGLSRNPHHAYARAENWLEEVAKASSSGIKMYSAKALWMIMKALDWIMGELVNRMVGSFAFGFVTAVDIMTQVLYQGALTSIKVGTHVTNLMIAILKFLGRTVVKGLSLTASFIKWVLDLLFNFLSSTAQLAMQKLFQSNK